MARFRIECGKTVYETDREPQVRPEAGPGSRELLVLVVGKRVVRVPMSTKPRVIDTQKRVPAKPKTEEKDDVAD